MRKVLLADLGAFAREVLGSLSPTAGVSRATLLILSGDLGAGKTTFVQVLAKALGVKETVQSPTYVLMKSYPIAYKNFTRLVHIDLYRLEKPEELSTLRLEDYLNDQKALVCIEWPERAGNLLPKPDITIKFSSRSAGEGERYIEMI